MFREEEKKELQEKLSMMFDDVKLPKVVKVKQIFEPYYTTKAGGNNLGLGLYYCWNVMSAHGGSIRVTSEPGQGSTFLLLFPVKKRRRSDDGTNPDFGGRR